MEGLEEQVQKNLCAVSVLCPGKKSLAKLKSSGMPAVLKDAMAPISQEQCGK